MFKSPGDKPDLSGIICSFKYEVKGIICNENIIEAMLGISILDEKDRVRKDMSENKGEVNSSIISRS